MQIKLHTDSVQATFHDAAYEPCRSEIRALLEDSYHLAPEAPIDTDDNQACEMILVKVEDKLVACGALHTDDTNLGEIKNLFTKGYEEHIEISKKMTTLLIKKAIKSGCRKIRHSLPINWTVTTEMLRTLGFTPIDPDAPIQANGMLTLELLLDA